MRVKNACEEYLIPNHPHLILIGSTPTTKAACCLLGLSGYFGRSMMSDFAPGFDPIQQEYEEFYAELWHEPSSKNDEVIPEQVDELPF